MLTYYDRDPQVEALEAFDNLWLSRQPWILIYKGPTESGKSHLLSRLIKERCQVNDIPYSLVSYYTYTFDIDALFTSMADSVISTSKFSKSVADRIREKLIGGLTAHWVGQPDDMRLLLLFDDYQNFETKLTGEQLSTFLDGIYHAHLRLPGLRVVIASREYCKMPSVWKYMEEFTVVRL